MPQMSGPARVYERPIQFGAPGVPAGGCSAIMLGAGDADSGDYAYTKALTSSENRNFIDIRVASTKAAGMNRLAYFRYFNAGAAQSADCLRAAAVSVAANSGLFGAHITAAIASGGSISGLCNGVRATFQAEAAVRSLGGTLAALQVDSYIGTGNVLPATCSFIRVSNEGAVAITQLFEIAASASGIAKGGTATSADGIAIRWHDGTTKYLMVGS